MAERRSTGSGTVDEEEDPRLPSCGQHVEEAMRATPATGEEDADGEQSTAPETLATGEDSDGARECTRIKSTPPTGAAE